MAVGRGEGAWSGKRQKEDRRPQAAMSEGTFPKVLLGLPNDVPWAQLASLPQPHDILIQSQNRGKVPEYT